MLILQLFHFVFIHDTSVYFWREGYRGGGYCGEGVHGGGVKCMTPTGSDLLLW